MYVVIPTIAINEMLGHARKYPTREVIGVLVGRRIKSHPLIEITDTIPYPKPCDVEMAEIPPEFMPIIGDECRKRGDYSVRVKGYYHSHPPDVFPLQFSSVDRDQYENIRRRWYGNDSPEPFVSIIIDPVSLNYKVLTLDSEGEEISLVKKSYRNLICLDYGEVRGFHRKYRMTYDEFMSELDLLEYKYKLKKEILTKLYTISPLIDSLATVESEKEGENLLKGYHFIMELIYNEQFEKALIEIEAFKKSFASIEKKAKSIKKEVPFYDVDKIELLNEKITFLLTSVLLEINATTHQKDIITENIYLKLKDKLRNYDKILLKNDCILTLKKGQKITEKDSVTINTLVDELIHNELGEEALKKLKEEKVINESYETTDR